MLLAVGYEMGRFPRYSEIYDSGLVQTWQGRRWSTVKGTELFVLDIGICLQCDAWHGLRVQLKCTKVDCHEKKFRVARCAEERLMPHLRIKAHHRVHTRTHSLYPGCKKGEQQHLAVPISERA